MTIKKCMPWILLLCMLLWGCVTEAQTTTQSSAASTTSPPAQTQPEGSLLPPQTQPGGPLLPPALPSIPTIADSVPPIVVPTVPVLPNVDPETQ